MERGVKTRELTATIGQPSRLHLKTWHHLGRFYFVKAGFHPFEPINLFKHIVRINWPEASALLDNLVDGTT